MAVIQNQVAVPSDGTPVEVLIEARANASTVLMRNTGNADLLIGPRNWLDPPTNLVAEAHGAPATLTSSGKVGVGETFTAGTYTWRVTAYNNFGETTGSLIVQADIVDYGNCELTWDPVVGATGYNVYRTVILGDEYVSPAFIASVEGDVTYTDTGDAATTGAVPLENTAQGSLLYPFKQNEVMQWQAKTTDMLVAQDASPLEPGRDSVDSSPEITILMLG